MSTPGTTGPGTPTTPTRRGDSPNSRPNSFPFERVGVATSPALCVDSRASFKEEKYDEILANVRHNYSDDSSYDVMLPHLGDHKRLSVRDKRDQRHFSPKQHQDEKSKDTFELTSSSSGSIIPPKPFVCSEKLAEQFRIISLSLFQAEGNDEDEGDLSEDKCIMILNKLFHERKSSSNRDKLLQSLGMSMMRSQELKNICSKGKFKSKDQLVNIIYVIIL